jgi:hypothetical protein
MAQSGITALATGVAMTDFTADLNPARPPQLERLIKNVFAHEDIIKGESKKYDHPERFKYKMTLANLKLFTVSGTYSRQPKSYLNEKLRSHVEVLARVVNNMGHQTNDPSERDVVCSRCICIQKFVKLNTHA